MRSGVKASGQGDWNGSSYTMGKDEKLIISGCSDERTVKTNKAIAIQREIGRHPVLVFGNTPGDFSMADYVLQNSRYRAQAYMLLCDDTERDYGDTEIAESFAAQCEAAGYHTVSMPGVAFKLTYDPSQPNNNMYARDWTRNESQYGFYATAKQVVPVNDPTICPIPPFQSCSMNKDDYRLDDVILMRAEALVETGKWAEAKDLVNQIRRRAAASTTYFTENTGVTANYEVRPYTDAEWSSEAFARQAVRWERRLELAMEGWRFFDLVRWGVAADVLNPYFAKEATRIAAYTDQGKLIAKYDAGDEFLPIPNTQLVLSKGVYVQSWPFK